ncbi:MAG: phenylalanine--tRNA ligase subunit alpha [Candidatus Omnitrophica bacterium]|nr:phenylalanine--tRNA ligase subunit alpha [Candidatus Omnitrophota bacterium]
MKEDIRRIKDAAIAEIDAAPGPDALESIRIKYLGRKGIITELFKKMSSVPAEERPHLGSLINEVKDEVTCALASKTKAVSGYEEEHAEKIDVTLPGVPVRAGKIHPLTKTIDEICGLFISLGFRVVEGPEIETEHYNFETLNIPLEHPSRDAFDTFYLSREKRYLLRSHTSPVQTRFMEKNSPPFSIIVPGKVFRPDATDASHSFMFHQVEGLVVGEKVRFSDLKGILEIFARQMFGRNTRMRFRPSFFPFTEPSAEVDISCILCGGREFTAKRCSMCGGKGWLEILGAGMVNPKVFEAVGYDTERVTGFAFGMGVERIAILKYGITDIRLFFENDIRFLRQF